jgi:hypothetical protein
MPKRTEKEEIKKDGAQGVKNSGRGMMKGDAKLGTMLIDYKHNEKTFTLTREAWRKLRKDAWNSQYRHPCISLVLGKDSDTKVAIIEWDLFRELLKGSDYE